MKDWNEKEIECAHSKGGVVVTAHPFYNLIRAVCSPWPLPEVVQKLYQSRQVRAFSGSDLTVCTSGLGYYCDLQSLHSEDAITWSVFGTASHGKQAVIEQWLVGLFELIDLPGGMPTNSTIFLWRRIPHPDNLVPGGPEIDVGILTENAIILGEAKWQSGVGSAQGKKKDKDQIQLRGEFLKKYGSKLYPNCSEFVVLGISLHPQAFQDTTPTGISFRSVTWAEICGLSSHPVADEVQRYYEWKKLHTKIINKAPIMNR